MLDKLTMKNELTIRPVINGFMLYRSGWNVETRQWYYVPETEMVFLSLDDLLIYLGKILQHPEISILDKI